MTSLSVVIPTLDEAAALPRLLASLDVDEVIVVDGGSTDGTPEIAERAGARVLHAPPGRGGQLAAGARTAAHDRLWFLHADAGVPRGASDALRAADGPWGCFAVRFEHGDPRLRFTAAWMTRRARLTGSCTGDMGIWADRAFYESVGGWPALASFEDLAFSDRARRVANPMVLEPALTVSARQWEQRGTSRTIARLYALRLAWRLGVDPTRLSPWYAGRGAR